MAAITDTYLARIQALLAKAESSTFPEEAEALLTKAQELMARHAIDEAMLAGASERDDIVDERVVVQAPYASAKSALLAAVAQANRCRVVVGRAPSGVEHATVVGHRSDVVAALSLFGALSVHAVRAMVAAPVPPHDTPRRFRHAFLLAYAGRIGQRLQEATAQATHAATTEHQHGGEASVALVLASRRAQVDATVDQMFGRLRTRRSTASSAAGFQDGRRAADSASLGRTGLGGGRRALPG
jgi:hypothetical protein